jgi:hypothetical protein
MPKAKTTAKAHTSLVRAAIHDVKMDLKPILTDGVNEFANNHKYAKINNIVATLLPLWDKHNITVDQYLDYKDGVSVLYTVVTHLESGDQLWSTAPLVVDKPGPQAFGSAITYFRRYALVSLFMITTHDDDGEGATTRPESATTTESPTPVKADQDKQEVQPPPSKAQIKAAFLKIDKADDYDKLRAMEDKIVDFSRRIGDRVVGLQIQGKLKMKLGSLSDAKKKVTVESVTEDLGLEEN